MRAGKCMHVFSKLPVRQVTSMSDWTTKFRISKLPVRQVTFRFGSEISFIFSKLPVRQVTLQKL